MLSNQKGSFSLLALFVVVLLALGGGFYFFLPSGPAVVGESPENIAENIAHLEKTLSDPKAQSELLRRNPNAFACLYSGTGNCKGAGSLVQLFDTSSSLTQTITGEGFTWSGFGCRGFPSAECPLRAELRWQPVCAPGYCENTKSFQAHMSLQVFREGTVAEEWKKSFLLSPPIVLTASAQCERGGGVFTGTECLSKDQASARQLASSGDPRTRDPRVPEPRLDRTDPRDSARSEEERRAQEESPEQARYYCPNTMIVQGYQYPVQESGPNKGQVSIPAVNGCPAYDTFIFQCSPLTEPSYEGEGQWIQVEAMMAPPCDAYGQPMGNETRQ